MARSYIAIEINKTNVNIYQFGTWHLAELSKDESKHWQMKVSALHNPISRTWHSTDPRHPTPAIIPNNLLCTNSNVQHTK